MRKMLGLLVLVAACVNSDPGIDEGRYRATWTCSPGCPPFGALPNLADVDGDSVTWSTSNAQVVTELATHHGGPDGDCFTVDGGADRGVPRFAYSLCSRPRPVGRINWNPGTGECGCDIALVPAGSL